LQSVLVVLARRVLPEDVSLDPAFDGFLGHNLWIP